MALQIIILAAGEGKRMCSSKPKVLHDLAGKSLIQRVLDTAQALQPENIFIVCGHKKDLLQTQLKNFSGEWVEQPSQLGTGHAVHQALAFLKKPNDDVLILYGDVPLISPKDLESLLHAKQEADLSLLTGIVDSPFGYGRILRKKNNIIGITEERDASEEEKNIKEINSGILITKVNHLQKWLPQLQTDNDQQEYYLTDIVKLAVNDKYKINSVTMKDSMELQGVNTMRDLAQLERYLQLQCAERLMDSGVQLIDPQTLYIRGDVQTGHDVVIEPNVMISGHTIIGDNVTIGANSILHNVKLGNNVMIKSHSVIEDAIINDDCVVGPFARIRPDTVLESKVKIGNFVEIKKSTIGSETKINHLSYIGDAQVGREVVIGAGTITCNYDGIGKHPTIIGDNAFIGSDTQLIAPVTIGENATIGAGSTIRKDAPPDQLTVSRREQVTHPNWKRPKK